MLASLTRSVARSRCQSTRALFATAAPVVDTRYWAPHATSLTAAETWFDALAFKDPRGERVMRAERTASFFEVSRRHLLLDVSRRPILTVERSPTFFEVRRRWKVYDGDSTSGSDLLFVAYALPSIFTSGDVHVHLDGRGEQGPDFILDSGGFFSTGYTLYRGGTALAEIYHSGTLLDMLFNRLVYSISVNAGVDRAFVSALTVILAEIRHDDNERRRRRRERTQNSRLNSPRV